MQQTVVDTCIMVLSRIAAIFIVSIQTYWSEMTHLYTIYIGKNCSAMDQ